MHDYGYCHKEIADKRGVSDAEDDWKQIYGRDLGRILDVKPGLEAVPTRVNRSA